MDAHRRPELPPISDQDRLPHKEAAGPAMSPGDDAPGPRVSAYALIGRHEQILLIANDSGSHVLPGGPVRSGEPIEHALQRLMFDQLGTTVASMEFCSVIEHEVDRKSSQDSASEAAFLFDVILPDLSTISDRFPCMHWWANEPDLILLRPTAIRDAILTGNLSSNIPWWAWSP